MTDEASCSKAIWYFQVAETGAIAGPYSLEELQHHYLGGNLDGLTYVWKDGMENWLTISECDDLKAFFYTIEDEITEDVQPDGIESKLNPSYSFLPPDALPESYKYVDPEGNTFIYNSNSSNWIPKEEYLKLLSYEPTNDASNQKLEDNNEEINEKKLKNIQKRKEYNIRQKIKKEKGAWLKGKKNPNVYVTGLPQDISFEELESLFKRAGIIKIDPETTLAKIRIYKNENNKVKGDALISFAKEESVPLAIKYLDDYEIRPEVHIHVEKAQFNTPIKEQPNKHRKVTLNNPVNRRKYLAAKYEQERLMRWGEDIDDGSGRRILLFKPMFSHIEAKNYEDDHPFYSDLKKEVEEEIESLFKTEKVTPIMRHPQGIVTVKFKTTADAEQAIDFFNGRYFAGKILEVYFYDGKTDLKAQCLPPDNTVKILSEQEIVTAGNSSTGNIEHSNHDESGDIRQESLPKDEEEDIQRLNEFGDWLEDQSSDEEFIIRTED